MEQIHRICRAVKSRIVNRPSEVQKRAYIALRDVLSPLRAPESERVETRRPVLIISGISMQGTGIFCDLLAYLRWVDFAQRMDYIPVIDMRSVPNLYLEDDLILKVNAYTYFYHQPTQELTLEEAYKAKEVYFVNRLDCPYDFTHQQKQCYRDVNVVKDWVYGDNRARYFAQYKQLYDRYFVVSEEAQAFTDLWHRRLIAPGEKTLGLLCRGTDYFTKHPYGHRVQPTVEQILRKMDAQLETYPVDKIYVATEDEVILASLIARYHEKIVYIDCPRLSTSAGESVAEAFSKRHVNRKENGLYYFASIAILARCDHLIAGKTMATQFIRTMRDTDFETEFYWELGRYGIDEQKADA